MNTDKPDKKYLASTKSKLGMLLLFFCIVAAGMHYFIWEKEIPKPLGKTLTIGTSSSITTALLIIAEERSFFEKEGLKVRIKIYKSAANSFDDMLSGNIPISGISETPIVYRSFERSDFKIFATAYTTSNDPKIIARSDRNITLPLDLSGKRIGSTRKGQSAHFFLHLFLLKYSIRSESVTIVHDSPAKVVQRLVSGDIDAASLFEPYASYAAQQLKDKALVFSEPGLYFKTFNLTAKTTFLKENRETIKSLLRALIRAEEFVVQNPGQTIEIIEKKLSMDRKIVRDYFKFSDPNVSLPVSLSITLKDEARWAIQTHMTDKVDIPDYKNLIDTDLLEEVRPDNTIMQ